MRYEEGSYTYVQTYHLSLGCRSLFFVGRPFLFLFSFISEVPVLV